MGSRLLGDVTSPHCVAQPGQRALEFPWVYMSQGLCFPENRSVRAHASRGQTYCSMNPEQTDCCQPDTGRLSDTHAPYLCYTSSLSTSDTRAEGARRYLPGEGAQCQPYEAPSDVFVPRQQQNPEYGRVGDNEDLSTMRAGVLTTPGLAYSAPMEHGTQVTGQVQFNSTGKLTPQLTLETKHRERHQSYSTILLESG